MVTSLQVEWKQRLRILGIVLGVYAGFKYVLPVTLPLLIGWLLAVWVHPLSLRVEKKFHIKRTIAGGICIVLLLGAISALLWWGLRVGLSQIRYWIAQYPALETQFFQLVDRCCQSLEKSMGILKQDSYGFIMLSMKRMQNELLSGIGVKTVAQATSWLRWGFTLVTGTVISVISGIFILRDLESLQRSARDYAILRGCRRILQRLKQTTAAYFKAQLLIMALISLLCVVGLYLMQSPYYLILGIGLGLLDALPLIGTGLCLYPAAIFYLLFGKPATAAGCVLLALLANFTREFFEPRLIGEKLGVYPIAILAAVYLGLVLYGPAGVLLGPLSLSLMHEIGKEWDVWG